jgi:hypothetical protein
MVERVFRRQKGEPIDLEAVEKALREMGQRLSGSVLEKVLNADGGLYQGSQIGCGKGHQAKYVEQREKQLVTVVGTVQVRRAYYHCGGCRAGVFPKDVELDIVGTSFSPGVKRMMGYVGGREPFENGRMSLKELAGIEISTKAVERTAEAIGEEIEEITRRELELAMSGKIVRLGPKQDVATMYIAMDGTGVPIVPRETQGRKGRGEDGKAKTREAKLGCVFTQTTTDKEGRPVRDENSTSYVGGIEEAGPFGKRIYAEAVRRGLNNARRLIVIGDGAPWIWGVADMHFPGGIQIVDLYHALERVAEVSKTVFGTESGKWKEWAQSRGEALKRGDVELVIRNLRRLRPRGPKPKNAVAAAIEYFQRNRERMRYGKFRDAGLFIGSGVVEAGCKNVIGKRLKQSGMWWTVRGANSIIWLRCCQLSGRWEDHWELRRAA